MTIQTRRREKQFKRDPKVGWIIENNSTWKCTIHSTHRAREELAKAKTLSFLVLTLSNFVTKEGKVNNRDYSTVSILCPFVDDVELNVT